MGLSGFGTEQIQLINTVGCGKVARQELKSRNGMVHFKSKRAQYGNEVEYVFMCRCVMC